MEYREREIDLIDVLWKVAFAWRKCLIVALICAIALPGFMYIRGLRSYNASIEALEQQQQSVGMMSKEEQSQKALEGLTDDEVKAVNSALRLTENYNAALKYLDNSVAMSIDPYNEEATIVEYYVDSDFKTVNPGTNEESYTPSVISAYIDLITNGTIAQTTASLEGVTLSAPFIQELINVDSKDNGNIIVVTIIAPDSQLRSRIAGVITDTFNAHTGDISAAIGSHSIRVMNEYQVTRIDNDLIKRQSDATSKVTTGKTSLDTATKALSDKQKSALNSLLAMDKKDANESSATNTTDNSTDSNSTVKNADGTTLTKPSFSIKYAVIGFFVGIILVAGVIALIDIFSKKLKYDTELKDIFGIDTYAVFKKEKQYKGFDAWLYKMRYKNVRRMTYDESVERLVTGVSLILKNKECDSLYVTGTQMNSLPDNLKASISDGLSGITVTYGDNVYYTPQSLVAADECGEVLIVEQLGGSNVDDIAHELTTLHEQDIDVIGGMLYE